jgi:ABC-type sugar transport system ATPase subunit
MESATQNNDTHAPLLEMRSIHKEFPGVVALDSVDFDLLPGEVHALIGENGAGKSTMIKVISGLYRADSGQMLVGGEVVDFHGPADSIARHIKVVYQELDLVPGLSVAENVFLGAYPKRSGGRVDWNAMHRNT